jgi:hypothetical protein
VNFEAGCGLKSSQNVLVYYEMKAFIFSRASFSQHFFYLSQAFVKAKLLIIPFNYLEMINFCDKNKSVVNGLKTNTSSIFEELLVF